MKSLKIRISALLILLVLFCSAHMPSLADALLDICPIQGAPILRSIDRIVVKTYYAGRATAQNFKEVEQLKADLSATTFKVVQDIIEPEAGVTVYKDALPKDIANDTLSTLFLGINVIVEEGQKMTPPVSGKLVIIDPVMARNFSCTSFPYYKGYFPQLLTLSEDTSIFLKQYRETVNEFFTRDMKQRLCSDPKNKNLKLCFYRHNPEGPQP